MARFPLLIVIFTLLIAFPMQGKADADKGYYLLSPERIAKVIDAGREDGRRVLFVYTSWCPYCRLALPKIIEIEKKKKGSVIAISVDKDPETLRRYLQSNHGEVPFAPIVWDRDAGALDKALSRFGIKLGRGIPFTALLDEYGYVSKQGVIDPKVSADYVLGRQAKSVSPDIINQ